MKSLRDFRLLIVLIVGFFGLWMLVGKETQDDDTVDPRRSSYNHTYPGCEAWFLLLRDLGVKADCLTEPFPNGLIRAGSVALIDPVTEGGSVQALALLDWVKRGGVLFFVESNPEPSSFGTILGARCRKTGATTGAMPATASTPLARSVRTLYAGPLRFSRLPRPAVKEFGDRYGTLLAEWSVGRGTVIALADPLPLTNQFIDREGNARLAVAIARKEPVVFDEYHQGYTADAEGKPTFWQQLGGPLRLAFLQIVFAALLMAWTASRRFGAALLPPDSPRRTAGEYVVSLGGLLRRAKAADTALEVIGARFRRELVAWAGAPGDLPDDLLLESAAGRTDLPRERIECALAASRGRLPDGMVPLDACRLIAEVREELQLHGRSAAVSRASV